MRRRKRKRVAVVRVPAARPTRPNEEWSMDFVSDALADGRRFRCFTLVDDCTHESPAIETAFALPAERVVAVLDGVGAERGFPEVLVCDNGTEACGSNSSIRESRSRMRLSKASTGDCGMSV